MKRDTSLSVEKMHSSQKNADAFGDIIIVGLGPAGLVAALEACAANKKVIAFTDRDKYIRGQTVLLSKDTLDYLRQYSDKTNVEDQKFLQRCGARGTAQIKDIEKFLYSKLREDKNITIIPIKDVEIESVGNDIESSFVKLSDGRKFYASHIIAADGEKSKFCALMNQTIHSNIRYEDRSHHERHLYHAAVQLQRKYPECALLQASFDPDDEKTLEILEENLSKKLEGNHGLILNLQDKRLYYYNHHKTDISPFLGKSSQTNTMDALIHAIAKLKDEEIRTATLKERYLIDTITNAQPPKHASQDLKLPPTLSNLRSYLSLGWDRLFYPNGYILSNPNNTKFYFVGEIPSSLFEETDLDKKTEDLKNWACIAIQNELGYEPESLEIRKGRPDKDKLQASAFIVKRKFCQDPLTKLPGGFFAIVGDALSTPNYNLGSGLNDAIKGSSILIDAIKDDKKLDSDKYLKWIYTRDQELLPLTPTCDQTKNRTDTLLSAVIQLYVHLANKSSQNKPVVSFDKLCALKAGIKKAQDDQGSADMYEALSNIQDPIEKHEHKNKGLGHRVLRGVGSIFSTKVTKTQSEHLLNEVKKAMRGVFSYMPYGR